MATLREVFVWPPSGFPDQSWCTDLDADAFAKVSRAVCERYSEALVTLGLTHKVSSMRIFTDVAGLRARRADGDVLWTRFVGEGRPEGFEVGQAVMPVGFAAWQLPRQQRLALDVVHQLVVAMAFARGIVGADRLEAARAHVEDHDFGYAWDGPWCPAPRRRGSTSPDPSAAVGELTARGRYRLDPDGFGTMVLQIARLRDGVAHPVVSSGEHRTWTTDRSFRRSARTLRWDGPTGVSVVPYVSFFDVGPTLRVSLTVPPALRPDPGQPAAGSGEGLAIVERLEDPQQAVAPRTLTDRAADVVVPSSDADQELLLSGSVAARMALAGHVLTSPDLIERLAHDSSAAVRRQIAARAGATPQVLCSLVADPDRQVRQALMGNLDSPPDLLVTLVGDTQWQVRWELMDRATLPLQVQQAISRCPDRDLRRMMTERIPLDPTVVSFLTADPDVSVRQMLAETSTNPGVLQSLADDDSAKVRAGAAGNKHAAPELLLRLALDPSADVRVRLIGRRPLSEPTCLLLAQDRSIRVRQALAAADWTPIKTLKLLTRDGDQEVVRRAELTLRRRETLPTQQ
jgi:hypothetical protein